MSGQNLNEWFENGYQQVLYTGPQGLYFKIVHKMIEAPFKNKRKLNILEVGAGNGEHTKFVNPQTYDNYVLTDWNPKLLASAEISNQNISTFTADATDLIHFKDNEFDRVIATCLLAHLDDMEKALAEWKRVTKPGGTVTIYVPCEPGILLRIFRNLFIAPKANKLGYDYLPLVYKDHKNHYPGMSWVIKTVFKADSIKRIKFPFNFLPWDLNFFALYQVTVK